MSLYQIKIYVQNNILLPIVHRHRKLADLYYFLFSSEFSREHQKVLKGKYIHLKAMKEGRPNAFHLRRQIHRLEKGLIMKNRRSLFALDYIGDTVNNYKILSEKLETTQEIDEGLLLWASHVLQKYFNVVDHNEVIKPLYELFCQIDHKVKYQKEPKEYVPYKRAVVKKSQISYDDFLQLTIQRRSVRYFLPDEVPYDLIEKACTAAAYAPSACNRQPFEFRIFTEKDMKNKVGAIPAGIRPFFKNIPVIIVLIGKLSAYPFERDRHVMYLDGGLASMSFILALETLGLSSLTINWPDIEFMENQMDNTIALEPDERPMMLIGLGYADPEGGIPYSQKKSHEQLLVANK